MTKHARFLATALSLVAVFALAASLCACGASSSSADSSSSNSGSSASSSSSTTSSSSDSSVITKASGKYSKGTHHARVTVKGYDSFTIKLDADEAPVSVANFCKLSKNGFYNGLGFYRIVEGFCLQGGTKGNTMSSVGTTETPIVGEFSDNGVSNKLADNFKKGTVAMARGTSADTATTAFFITLATNDNVSRSLDGKYAAFGTIDASGMKTVSAIVKEYKKYATSSSGAITSKKHMPIIKSIDIVD